MDRIFSGEIAPDLLPKTEIQQEENYLALWGYLKRRYPTASLESKNLTELIQIKNELEGPGLLRESNPSEIAMVIKR